MIKRISLLIFVLSFMFVLTAPTAFAAKPDHAGGGNGGGGSKPGGGGGGDTGGSSSLLGYDISYPQCGSRRLPTDHAFGIVGVNRGLATTVNECLADEMLWAQKASDAVEAQDAVQLYANTGNPGEVLEKYGVDTWPTDNVDQYGTTTDNPYGVCSTDSSKWHKLDNSLECSWQYGWERAANTANEFFKPAATKAKMPTNVQDYKWWLDVETMNSWQEEGVSTDAQDPEGLAKNVAALEGMAAYYQLKGAEVGIYSTGYQWGRITGETVGNNDQGLNLRGIDSWLAGAWDEADAMAWCKSETGLTGGQVSLVQFVHKN